MTRDTGEPVASAGADKWYNPVEFENTLRQPLVTGDADLKGVAPATLRQGRWVDTWESGAWVKARTPAHDGQPDDVLQEHLGLPIYSPRLRAALDAASITGIQYLPIEVRRSDGSRVGVFFIANILHLVQALEVDHSLVRRFGPERPDRQGEIRSIEQAVLRRDALAGLDILRLAEYRVFVAVSDRFRRAFEAANCTGYMFCALLLS